MKTLNKIVSLTYFPKAFWAVMVIAVTLFMGSCSSDSSENQATEHAADNQAEESHSQDGHDEENIAEITPEQYRAAGIQLGSIEARSLSSSLRVNGIIDAPPQNLLSVSAPMGGFVRKTDLLQGMKLRKGQLIATLEHPDYVTLQQEYVQSKNQLAYMEKEYKRQEELSRENVSALKIFQQTEAEYRNLKAQVKALEEKLAILGIKANGLTGNTISRYINIYSPINGFVSEVNVNLGKYVSSTDVMFELIDIEHVHAELTVYEKDLPKISIGQKVRFTVPNDPTKEYQASVYLIGKKISEDRSVRVHAHLEKDDTSLIPGMYIQAAIEAGDNQVPSVPDEAIVQFEGNYFIYLDKGLKTENGQDVHTFEMTEVQTGVSENGFSELILPPNLNASNVKVVTKGAFALLGKMKNSEEDGHAH